MKLKECIYNIDKRVVHFDHVNQSLTLSEEQKIHPLTLSEEQKVHLVQVDSLEPRMFLEGQLIEVWVKKKVPMRAVYIRDLSLLDFNMLQRSLRLRDGFFASKSQ